MAVELLCVGEVAGFAAKFEECRIVVRRRTRV